MEPESAGPKILLGVDVVLCRRDAADGSGSSPPSCVMVAIYAATTVRDPMAKRVKALNERREQLKAGIVASTNEAPRQAAAKEPRRPTRCGRSCQSLKVLQDEPAEGRRRSS